MFIIKDLLCIFFLFIIASLCFIKYPIIMRNTDNLILSNPLIVPSNIIPEDYLLVFYLIIRIYPIIIAIINLLLLFILIMWL